MAIAGFASGTLIRTPRGDVAVEDLVVGDHVVTTSGAHHAIKSLERSTPNDGDRAAPLHVRIAPNAFGDGKPYRGLDVSSEHRIGVDVIGEVLIPAGLLTNGSTVQTIDIGERATWQVALDGHDLVLANGMAAETRHEARSVDAPGAEDAGPAADGVVGNQTDLCRPAVDEGPLLESVRIQMRRRAEALGWRLAETPLADLHLVADGRRIEPTVRGLAARFAVPAGVSDLALVSRTARPCDIRQSSDLRVLGVLLAGFVIDDGFGECERIAVDDSRFAAGLHNVEDGSRRWTTGRVPLPADIVQAHPHGFFLRVDLAGPVLPHWVAPEASAAPDPAPHPAKFTVVA